MALRLTQSSEQGKGKVKIRYLHSIANWTAAVCATLGIACVFAYTSAANSRSYVLIAAEAAATIGVAALLVSVLVVYLLIRRQSTIIAASSSTPGDRSAGDCVACGHERREVLNDRLDIDEPRVCSQYMIACTCWSFCAGSKHENAPCAETLAAAGRTVPMRNLLSKVNGLPVVRRNGMDNCPFRFASPFARLGRADGDVPNSFESPLQKV